MPPASDTPTSDPGQAGRYLTTDASQLLWSELDGEFALFHRPSGRTHFLNAPSAYLLLEVLREPRTASEATDLLLAQQQAPADELQHEYVAGLLRRFAELGIIDG